MSWYATLYSQASPPLDHSEIQSLAQAGAEIQPGEDGTQVVRWSSGAQLTLFPDMPADRLPEHLNGLMGFILHLTGGEVSDWNRDLLQFVNGVQTATACRIDASGPHCESESLLISMACTYVDCLIFAHENLYNAFGKCIFGPEDEPPLADLKKLSVRRGRIHTTPQTDAQAQRQARIQARLDSYGVPSYAGPIRWIPDDEETVLRPAVEVAARLLAMHGTVCYARGLERERAEKHIGDAPLSPEEAEFFERQDENLGQSLIWRLEALVVLMWALGLAEAPPWPDSMCDPEAVHQRIFAATEDPAAFVTSARLRPVAAILDELELTTRLHWALRNSHGKSVRVPENLNWASDAPRIAFTQSPLSLVVGQRHHALNWLIGFGDYDWDDVDTPT